jgi:hypothetical protein
MKLCMEEETNPNFQESPLSQQFLAQLPASVISSLQTAGGISPCAIRSMTSWRIDDPLTCPSPTSRLSKIFFQTIQMKGPMRKWRRIESADSETEQAGIFL